MLLPCCSLCGIIRHELMASCKHLIEPLKQDLSWAPFCFQQIQKGSCSFNITAV